MKGLLLKDLYVLKEQQKVMLLLLSFYVFYTIMTGSIMMLLAMVGLICMISPITTLSFDEKNKWDRLALTMPLTREKIVRSKYVFSLLLALASVVFTSLFGIVIVSFTKEMAIAEVLLSGLGVSGAGLVLVSFLYPILFKFGIEKGRFVLLIVFFLPFVVGLGLSKLQMPFLDKQILTYLAYASPLIVAGLFFASFQLSKRIYEKIEF